MGALADVAQLILRVGVTYVLLCLVRMMRRLHAINRFWVERWWSNYQAEAAGDHQAPSAFSVPLPATPVTQERGEGRSG
jgi:hypothetical protein